MAWDYKHTHFARAKIWLDTENRKILLAESFSRHEKIFDYNQIKTVRKGSARSSTNSALFITVLDIQKPNYQIEFLTEYLADEWFDRLSIVLELHAVR